MLARIAGGYRFQTHPDLAPYVERFANREVSHRLSTAALETLAIVAYRQPVSRAQISALRGVNVDGVVRLLEQRGYIEAVGRAEGPGQPVLYGTTDLFLERLGLRPVEQLPAVEDFLPGPEVARADARGRRLAAAARAPADPGPVGDGPTAAPTTASASRRCWPGPGFGSRRVCDDLIADGRVTVNGERGRAGPAGRPGHGPGRGRRGPGARRPRAWSTTCSTSRPGW